MRSRLALVALSIVLPASACTRVGVAPTTPAPEAARNETAGSDALPDHRAYAGTASIGGAPFALDLQLERLGGTSFEARLRIERLDLEAAGRGTATGERLDLRLAYGGTCEGTVTISASLDRGGTIGRGRLEASDCTGTETGPISLTLSSSALADPTRAR